MKQVLIRRGQIAIEDVPAPLIEPGHVLVEVAYSMISSGTEISAVTRTGKSLIKRAIEQPDKVMKLMIQLPKAAGCNVIGFDIDPRRVSLAEELGADKALHSMQANEVLHFTEGHGVDTTIITAASQSNEIVQQAMEITRKKGKVVLVGNVGLGLKRSPFYEKEIDFLISCSYGPGRYDESYERQGLEYMQEYLVRATDMSFLADREVRQ